MFARIFTLRTIELGYMNELPLSARKAAIVIFRDFLLDELVAMREKGIDKGLEQKFKIPQDIWQLTLDYVILTKLSTFSIHPYLQHAHLVRLHQIAALAFGEENANITTLIGMAEENDATIMVDWLKQLQVALTKKKA
ncbi:hypothetical protein [Hydrogenovibrio kuenenii]|uniref:hypothetical protein n=1 Tax=Hydrogenovibrio kuenenii TaxID=63658 RepID=UPI0012FF45FA|nr:hypothetical protein [Hydrogenovibrio kuenenii]